MSDLKDELSARALDMQAMMAELKELMQQNGGGGGGSVHARGVPVAARYHHDDDDELQHGSAKSGAGFGAGAGSKLGSGFGAALGGVTKQPGSPTGSGHEAMSSAGGLARTSLQQQAMHLPPLPHTDHP